MFDSAQRLYFWWFSAVVVRGEVIRKQPSNSSGGNKPELVDVLALMTRLTNEGKLSEQQLDTLAKYGRRRREPHTHVWAEKRESELWSAAMATLDTAFRKLGWVA